MNANWPRSVHPYRKYESWFRVSRLRHPASICFLCLVFCLMGFAVPGPQTGQDSQQVVAQQRTPTFSVEAAMVVVDVTVRDGKGKLVPDLKREDFRIYEDNKPQNVVTFSAE